MKKIYCLLLALLLITTFCFVGCNGNGDSSLGSNPPADNSSIKTNDAEQSENVAINLDLTTLSGTMVYAQVYNMLVSPNEYIGKTIKMEGNFGVWQDPNTKKYYFSCLIVDATACCAQGFEFVLKGDYSYPDDYPEINTLITVTGTFDVYVENGYRYCQLIDATMEI